ncbi:MAG: TonB-dependent receptor [Opitutaceae bacterium]|nr:TonB-dependent receptor [Opitutaceae bacterium]
MKKQTLAELLRAPLCCAALWFSFAATEAGAQTTSTGADASSASTPTATPEAAPEDEAVVVLDPFVVSAQEDEGSYRATSTLAGNRIRTDLKDVGASISVVTTEFLKDTGATNNESLLQYTTSTEVAGVAGNFAGLGNGNVLDDTAQRMAPHESTRVRGLAAADNTRDFFLTDIPWDSYNVGRIDLQRGPNAILFGFGSPAGIINGSVNGASFETGGNVEFRIGSYGSYRVSLDANVAIIPDELAARVAILEDNAQYRQDPAYNDDGRIYTALRYDPKFLRFEGARTQFNLKYEKGNIEANRPRILPPGDLITPWWSRQDLNDIRVAGGLNPLTVGLNDSATIAAARAAGDLGAGVRGDNSAYYNRKIGAFGRNYGGVVAVFPDARSENSYLQYTELSKDVTSVIKSVPWTIMSGVTPRSVLEGTVQEVPNSDFYKDERLRDRTIFDFYNNLLDGPNKHEWSNFDAFNVALSQTFLDNKFGFELAYDDQTYDRGQTNLASDFGQSITLDMNNHLVDGSVNPNYGRAVIVSDQYQNNIYKSWREAKRATAFLDLDAKDYLGDSFLGKLLGRSVITGLLSQEEAQIERRNWFRYAADLNYGLEVLDDPVLRNRTVNTMNYLSDSIADRATISGAGIGRIYARQIPQGGPLRNFSTEWTATNVSPTDPWVNPYGQTVTQVENPANYLGWAGPDYPLTLISDAAGQRDELTVGAELNKSITDSYAGNWQMYMFDGVFVPSYGVRIDKQKYYAMPSAPLFVGSDVIPTETVNLDPAVFRLPDDPTFEKSSRSESISLVLHTPRAIQERMPWNTGLSVFYNKSENVDPAAGRVDINGNPLESPNGETEEYGFVINTLDGKVTFRATYYETTVRNAALDNFGGTYMIWGAEAWAQSFAWANLQRGRSGGWADFTNGYDPTGIVAMNTPADGWSDADILRAQQVGDAISQAYFDTALDDSWYQLWNINVASLEDVPPNSNTPFLTGTQPPGLTITGDTYSEGYEFELMAQPISGLNLSINATKTEAMRMNMAQSLVDWVEERWATYNTPVMLNGQQVGVIGDVRFWNGGYSPGESLKGKFGREFMGPYWLYRIQEGSSVPELREWRFNAVANYSFGEGVLRGFNIGGGFRWQDKQIVGYPVLPGATVDDPRAFDLENPYMGPSESNFDLWVGYNRQITEKIDWRIQLNIRNLFADESLIPVTVQPDGSPAVSRIPDLTTWTLTNTFSF